MDIIALEQDLKSRALKPIYLFYGQETFLRERYTARLIGIIDERLFELNFENLLAEENPVPDVLQRAQSMPFLSPPRVVIVRGVDRYTSEELFGFNEYINDPNESTCLVLVADKPDFRVGIFKTLRKQGLAVSFDSPKGTNLVKWLREAGRARGYEVSARAARKLIEQVGTELNTLDHELEKVCLYAGSKTEVTEEDVIAAARISQTASIFVLGDALGEQDRARAISALKDLMQREHHLSILAMIVRHFRLLFKIRIFLKQTAALPEIQKALGLPPFVIRKYMSQAKGLNLVQLKKGLTCLQEADLALKSTGAPAHLILEKLVLDLTSLRPIRRPETWRPNE